MATLTISLPESLKDFIDQELESKGFGNVSEYLPACSERLSPKKQMRV